ncbi:holotricin-3 [Xiamenia xianingshaonis]|uniref:Holotricin-3 n=1 Tax=Xiamenia xianingshaonis TaxID=2682776 RepID=A0A9E6SUQ4_9ACTN|nr:holotricin-3 [Xiamenia xianingshaonis]NGM18285.1 holotricin-3 [Eggerthellaceae bacterium zg-893]NHM13179.1 holotricin-3 [Xiamenia xianingshaonis]NHM15451.1 holotricin-3 [Xiamenia xianingshaonis]QTU84728.1 holotricin-3 [Xiamenia xianingshaonis]
MAENERRPGDWQHKEQRRRSANDIVGADSNKKWYQDTFWIIFFLVVFWPVGIVLCWRSSWPVWGKATASVLLAGVIYVAWSMQQAVAGMV